MLSVLTCPCMFVTVPDKGWCSFLWEHGNTILFCCCSATKTEKSIRKVFLFVARFDFIFTKLATLHLTWWYHRLFQFSGWTWSIKFTVLSLCNLLLPIWVMFIHCAVGMCLILFKLFAAQNASVLGCGADVLGHTVRDFFFKIPCWFCTFAHW